MCHDGEMHSERLQPDTGKTFAELDGIVARVGSANGALPDDFEGVLARWVMSARTSRTPSGWDWCSAPTYPARSSPR